MGRRLYMRLPTKDRAKLMSNRVRHLLKILSEAAPPGSQYYYIDSVGGNDANDGHSVTKAWQTVAKVNASAALIKPGDTVRFKRGQTWREQLTVPSSGSAGNHITFGAYGGGVKPILDGSDVVPGAWASMAGVNDLLQFVTDVGGDAVVPAIYDTRFGITTSGGMIDAWDDARGAAGYGPQLAQTLTKRPAWDAVNKIITFDGSNDQLTSALFAGFDMSTDKTLVAVLSGAADIYKGMVTLNDIDNNSYLDILSHAAARYYTEANNQGAGAQPLCDSGVAFDATRRLVYAQDDPGGVFPGTFITVADTAAVGGFSPTFISQNFFLDIGGWFENVLNRWANITVRAVLVIEGLLSANQISVLQAWAYNYHAAVLTSGATPGGYATVWQVAYAAAAPVNVLFNGVAGVRQTSILACNSVGKWFWNANVLYVYATADPSGTISVSIRDNCVYFNGADYCTVQDITTNGANLYGINIGAGDHQLEGAIVQRCLATYNYADGIFEWVSVSTTLTQILNNEVSYNGLQGAIDGVVAMPGGIEIINAGDDLLVSRNNIHHNAIGMEVDQLSTDVTVRFNYIHDNVYIGFQLNNADNTIIIYNLICNSGTGWGIKIWDIGGVGCSGIEIYNNVLYNNAIGIIVEDEQTNLKIKNNLLSNNIANSAAEEIKLESGHVYAGLDINYNLYYRAAGATYWAYGGINYTFANWKIQSGQDANAVNADPLLIGIADFHLQAGSPAINAGVNVGLTLDYDGVAVGNPPEIGAYEKI
jgi:hypothetical protein